VVILYECNHCKQRYKRKCDCFNHITNVHYQLFSDRRFANFDISRIEIINIKLKEKRRIEKEFAKLGIKQIK